MKPIRRHRSGNRSKRRLMGCERLEDRRLMASIAEFSIAGSGVAGLVTGLDGAIWFTEGSTAQIGRMTLGGEISHFPLSQGVDPKTIIVGPDGNFWFTAYGASLVGKITPAGVATTYSIPGANPEFLTAGPDGNIWFTETGRSKIGKIVPSGDNAGTITEYNVSSIAYGITAGPDGNIWFTMPSASRIGKIVPSGDSAGTITYTSLTSGRNPSGITAGSDGNVWFTQLSGNRIARITPDGTVSEFDIPTRNSFSRGIVSGPGGDLYYTQGASNKVGRVSVDGVMKAEYTIPSSGSFPWPITIGPDGHVWFAEISTGKEKLARLNLEPVGNQDSYGARINTALEIDAANGVLSNDLDEENDPISAVVSVEPTHGTLTLNPDGSFRYQPDQGYAGPDGFTYILSDGTDSTGEISVTIGVVGAPVALDDEYVVPVGGVLVKDLVQEGLQANDTNPNLGNTSETLVQTNVSHGELVVLADGTFTYTPSPGFHGIDSFTYTNTDSGAGGASGLATVRLIVNTPPTSAIDRYIAHEERPLVVNASQGLLANDSDVDQDVLRATIVANPMHGSLNLSADGSFTYTPRSHWYGEDSFIYRAFDGFTYGPTVMVTIDVKMDNAPVAVNDSYTTTAGSGPLRISAAAGLLANDTDPDGDALVALLLATPRHGRLNFFMDGSFNYTPDEGFSGDDFFAYLVHDQVRGGNEATVVLKVNPTPANVSDRPTTTLEGTARLVTVGQQVAFTARVATTPAGVPTGIVRFVAGDQTIGTATLDSSGVARLSSSWGLAGAHAVIAVYDGDSTHVSTKSDPFVVSVTPVATFVGPRVMSAFVTGTNTISIKFNRELAVGPTTDLSNFSLVGPRGRKFTITVASSDQTHTTITLATLESLDPRRSYRLFVNGKRPGRIVDAFGIPLVGNHSTRPGSNFSAWITFKPGKTEGDVQRKSLFRFATPRRGNG